MNDADGDLELLTGFSSRNPEWSPDSTRFAYISGQPPNTDIYIMNIDDRNVDRLTHSSVIELSLAWSPSGEQIAFSSNPLEGGPQELYILDAQGVRLQSFWDTSGAYEIIPFLRLICTSKRL
jgi:TolB protein